MKYLVTGGCGFIGSNFIRRCFEQNDHVEITNIDAMLIGSHHLNLQGLKNKNYKFVQANICNKKIIQKLTNKVDYVINFAAESHVDRSISYSLPFIQSNIIGVYTILEALCNNKDVKFLQISTDEVYGENLRGYNKEYDELNPSNPYSGSKAAAEMLIRSYSKTYDLDITITRCTNNFGPRQFPEKLIPKTIISALTNEPIPLHGDGTAKRQWIHVLDHCDAILKILSNWGKSCVYNIGGNTEISNLDLVRKILKMMNKPEDLIIYVQDRPGQDKRYGVNSTLIEKLIGFTSTVKFQTGLQSTIDWYISNQKWWKNIPSFKKIKNATPWLK